jgi:hypothetical protein
VNYFADVLPFTRRFSQPTCPECHTTFTWQGYLFFRACQNGHARKTRLWIVQLIILGLSIYTSIKPPSKIGYFLGLALLIYFGVITVIDLEHRLILHPTSIFGAFLGLIVGTVAHGFWSTLLGGLGGLLIMLTFYGLGVLFTRIRAKRLLATGQEPDDEEALGSGDVILVTILGFIVGSLIWFCLLYGILLGGLVSLLIILWMVVSGNYKKNALMTFIPYGPYFIITAALIIYFPKLLAMIVPD